MTEGPTIHPGMTELHDYCLGRCDPGRAAAIEAFLADGPDCDALLSATPDDALVRHLRGSGILATPIDADRSDAPTEPALGGKGLAGETDIDLSARYNHPRYRFLRKLGQGGMGTVYLAEHRFMHRLVAIKLLRGSPGRPQLTDRFRREVQAAALLSHPHLVTAHDADEIDGTPFLVMEYVEGESLDRRLTRDGPLPAVEASALIRQAALGLEFARQAGMVHRDIKPHNLMVTASPDASAPGVVKVLDFGLARAPRQDEPAGGQLTGEHTIMGTADYMAPEQARDSRNADTRSDVYSLGCTLYQLLTGRVPYPGGVAMDKIIRHAVARPEPLGDGVPPGLAAVVYRMMAREPEDRYQTPGEVAAALEPFTTADSDTIIVSPPRPRSRRLRRIAAALVGCMFLAGGLLAAHRYVPSDVPGATEPPSQTADPADEPAGFLRHLPALGRNLRNARFSPDGKYVLAVDWNVVCIWEAATGQPVRTLRDTAGWWSAVFTVDSRSVICQHSDGIFRRWDVESGTSAPLTHLDFRTGFEGETRNLEPWAISADGKYLACIFSAPAKTMGYVLLDLASGEQLCQIRPLSARDELCSVAFFSADGKQFYTSDVSRRGQSETTLRVWDVPTGKLAKSFPVAKKTEGRLALAARGRYIGFDSIDDNLYHFGFVDLASGQPTHDVATVQANERSAAFVAANGSWYVSIWNKRERVEFFDLSTGKAMLTHEGIPGPAVGGFSADDRYAAVPGQGGVWLFRLPPVGGPLP